MAVVQHIPAWLKNRTAWYRECFNICNYVIASIAAWGAVRLILHADGLVSSTGFRLAVAGLACSIVLVGLNHAMLAPMLLLGHGHTIRESGLFSFHGFSTELALAGLGVVVATFWYADPWLIPFAVAPVLLIHRSLSVPQLEAEARVDPKTGLFNARHFGAALNEEIVRSQRFERPLALIMADLDLLRDINNTYGHLAGDAVLKGIAEVFRTSLRHYDVPARFGGEEFSILLPETSPEEAMEIAERIRREVADRTFDVETSSEPIRATISVGVAAYPRDGQDANELIHQADLAVYRAKLQGRNRALDASSEPLAVPSDRKPRLVAVPETGDHLEPLPPAVELIPPEERRHPRTHAVHGPRFLSLSPRLALLVGLVSVVGIGAGVLGLLLGSNHDVFALIALVVLVGFGQALAIEVDDGGSISVSAVGSLAGAALFGPRAALVLAATTAVVEWSARRSEIHRVLFNIGALTLSSLAAACVFAVGFESTRRRVRHGRGRPRRRARLLRGQHRPPQRGDLDGGPRARAARLARAVRVARDALDRLRLRRRRDGDRVPRCGPVRAGGLRGPAAPHAQDAGGVPQAHAAKRTEAAGGRGDDPEPERVAREGQPAPARALDGRDGEPLRHRRRARRVHGRALHGASSSSRWRSAASSGSRRPSSTCSATRRSSTTSASWQFPTRSCSSPPSSPTTSGR